jgi:hypothetical protein
MSSTTDLELARQRLAAKWIQTYTKNAILNGEWDSGFMLKNELEQVRFERAALREINPDD